MGRTMSLRRRLPSGGSRVGGNKGRGLGRAGAAARSEVLEGRTLLSAWGTINTYSYPGGSPRTNSAGSYIETAAYSITADAAGNMYAAGQAYDSAGTRHAILLERFAGSAATNWSTIQDIPNAGFNKMAIDGAGDLLVTGQSAPYSSGAWFVSVRPAGQSGFTTVNDAVSSTGQPGIALDGSGNVFLDGTVNETVNGVTQQHWVVQRESVAQLVSGQSAFTTVDDFFSLSQSNPHNITYVPGGTSAGLYVVGTAGQDTNWIVRKSADGGNTWSTVDNFVVSGATEMAWGVSGDLTGNNVYVTGYSNKFITLKQSHQQTFVQDWIVRKSGNGGASWTTSDDYTAPNGVNLAAFKIQPDLLGNMYVVGRIGSDAIVRANTGSNGSWITIDDYYAGSGTGSANLNLFVDSANNHYTCGGLQNTNTNSMSWLIRTDASTAASPAAVAAVFSSTQVSGGTDTGDVLHPRKHRHG